MPDTLPKLVVMVSGGGSNLQAILDAIATGSLRAQVVAVISNRANAYALERAQAVEIATEVFPLKPYLGDGRGREQYDRDLAERVRSHQPDLLVLAGWMHILSAAFLENVGVRTINLHPALPGQFPGTDAIARAFTDYQHGEITHSGVMIHDVVVEVDAGAVIATREVPFLPDDTLEAFEARMHTAEHALIVQAIKQVIGG